MRDEAAVLKSTSGQRMALLGVAAKGRVEGLLFELSIEQRYRNPEATNVEAVYTFPLPSAAVLLGFEVRLGERTLSGVVVEKRQAEEKYEGAIEKGDAAFMLERAGDGLYTVNLGNLLAGEEATIRYRYAQLLRFEQGSVRLAIPTVIAPRYGDPATGRLAPHQVPASDLAVSYPFTLALELRGAVASGVIASPSHAIAVVRVEDGVDVSLTRGAFLDRDFVLTVGGLAQRSLAVVASDGDGFVALASFCAELPPDTAGKPLALKLLVDCSGSMGGDSIDAAKRALHRILEGLTPADRISYSRFGSKVQHEIARLEAADGALVRRAAGCIAGTQADLGGTEMEGALREVFKIGGGEQGAPADVMLITDGEIWGADSLIAAAQAAHQRVFVVGIGSAPAEGVLRRLADATGGACEFVAPNEGAEAAILRMFGRLRAPRVERAGVVWPAMPSWTVPLPQGLFGGETIHAFAGFESLPGGEAELRLDCAGGRAPLTARVALPLAAVDATTLARMAAVSRMPTHDEASRLALALRYSLVTEQTNFIVVHERAEGEKAVDLPKLSAVAQMHAAGWGGVGTVRHRRVEMSASFESLDMMFDPSPPLYDAFAPASAQSEARRRAPGTVDRTVSKRVPPTNEPADRLDALLTLLDRAVSGANPPAIPVTIDALATLHVPESDLAALHERVVDGEDETDVVASFMAWLESRARLLGLSRQLLRWLERASVRRTPSRVI